MKKPLLCFSLALAIVFWGQAWAAILHFDPAVSSISIGESADVNVVISGLGEFDDVGAFDFDVLFNESVLAFDSYYLTDNLGDISAGDAADWSWGYSGVGTGTVNLAEVSWLADLSFQPDSFALASLTFTGIGAGSSALLLDNIWISDAWGCDISTTPGLGVASVAPVPEPGTMLLLCTGLVGLAGVGRKKLFKR